MSNRIWWAILGIMIAHVSTASSFSQTLDDVKAADNIMVFLGVVENYAVKEGIPLTIAEVSGQEALVYAAANSGLMDAEEAAGKLYVLGRQYWDAREYESALRVLEKSIDLAPDGFVAAKSWTLIGNTYYGNLARPKDSIAPFR
ncbi:MAG: hypothetical protein KDA96_06820, partial [Planctomycetaceae bacterium]|nr:hypothetical protein [Planctomycetaceae bacterium]